MLLRNLWVVGAAGVAIFVILAVWLTPVPHASDEEVEVHG
jgi:hypothetical protein